MAVLLQINTTANWGSHGTIAEKIGAFVMQEGWESHVAFGRYHRHGQSMLHRIGNRWDQAIHLMMTRCADAHGRFSTGATCKLIREIEDIKPDLIHLHNLHGYYINYQVLFDFLRKYQRPMVWTLHDCWPFTGHCAHYMHVNCEGWKEGCPTCSYHKETYPVSWKDDASVNFAIKKQCFQTLPDLHLVAVSQWSLSQLEQSFLKDKDMMVIRNGIDLNDFGTNMTINNIRKRLEIPTDSHVVLGVASNWFRKGLPDICHVAESLPADYITVIVGDRRGENVRKHERIRLVERTQDKAELQALYAMSDVFFNPTYEDNFPTTLMESLACGTPIVTYDTGGCAEAVSETSGFVVDKGDVSDAIRKIRQICEAPSCDYSPECRAKAMKEMDEHRMLQEYWNLYQRIL